MGNVVNGYFNFDNITTLFGQNVVLVRVLHTQKINSFIY